MLNKKIIIVCVVSLISVVARAEWGNGLRHECKSPYIPISQQAGWDCTEDTSWESLKSTFQNAEIKQENGAIKITFSEKLFFDVGSSNLNSAADGEIQKLASWMNNHPDKKVRVEGHSDATGDRKVNQQLSEKRAQAVADAVSEKGISTKRVKFLGYGQNRPIASNDSEQGRQANRRVDVFILN